MKAAKVTLIILVLWALVGWVGGGDLRRTLPFLGGHPPGIYDIGALVMVVITVVALRTIRSAGEAEDETRTDYLDAEDECSDDEEDEDE